MPERASTGTLYLITLEDIEFALFGWVLSDEERSWRRIEDDDRGLWEGVDDGSPDASTGLPEEGR